jgi:hypothetical protein
MLTLGKIEKNHQVALLLKNLEKTYKSSNISTTFTRMAWVTKEQDITKVLGFGRFFPKILIPN